MKKFLRLVLSIALCESAGLIGSLFTFSSVRTWYPTLVKPVFTPPSWVFGPAWTILYLLMGISLFLVWGKKKVNLKWFWIQLVLNTSWSVVFFGLKAPALAFIVIAALWVSIVFTIQSFKKVNQTAAFLLYPYLAWVSFASLLNLSLVFLNR